MEWTGERWVPGKSPPSVERQHLARYHWAKKFCCDRDVTDVACGCGHGAWLLSRVADHVHAFDSDANAIHYASENYQQENIVWCVDNIESPIKLGPEPYDVIVAFEIIEHLAHPAIALACIESVLAPGGLILLSTPNRAAQGRPRVPVDTSWHICEYNREELAELVKPRFETIAWLGQMSRQVPARHESDDPAIEEARSFVTESIGVEYLDVAEFLVYVGRKL